MAAFYLSLGSLLIFLSCFASPVSAVGNVRDFRSSFSSNRSAIGKITITTSQSGNNTVENNTDNYLSLRKLGTVILNAKISNCGQSHPFSGNFRVCRNQSGKYSCFNLSSGKNGVGKISLPPGDYEVLSPLACPPGWMCLLADVFAAGGKPQTAIVDPITWSINPQKFTLNPGGFVSVEAQGTNSLLMCPIQIEAIN